MKKRLAAMALGVTMALSVAACGNSTSQGSAGDSTAVSSAASEAVQESGAESVPESDEVIESIGEPAAESSADSEEVLTGGWETNQGSMDPDDSSNKDAKEAFEKAVENLDGYDYELIACLGSQVVSGTNYSCLVKGTPAAPDTQSEYLIAVVYEDLEGNAELTGTRSLLDADADGENDGGWSYNQGAVSLDENADAKQAYEKAMGQFEGGNYEPVAYIGSRTASGTNYAIFCRFTAPGQNAEPSFSLLTIFEGTDGTAGLTNDEDVDLSAGAYDAVDGTDSENTSDDTVSEL